MTEQYTFFWNGPFSQWHRVYFTIGDTTFSCAEQWMMYSKAKLFGDEEIAKQILETDNPKEQKALGRKVKGFDVDVWNEGCRSVVYEGNKAKFTQNLELLQELMSTKGTTLVEASPYDRIWGIGLGEWDPRSQNRETWQGTNWLGEVLTQLREDLSM